MADQTKFQILHKYKNIIDGKHYILGEIIGIGITNGANFLRIIQEYNIFYLAYHGKGHTEKYYDTHLLTTAF